MLDIGLEPSMVGSHPRILQYQRIIVLQCFTLRAICGAIVQCHLHQLPWMAKRVVLRMRVLVSQPYASAEWDGKWVITGGTGDLKELLNLSFACCGIDSHLIPMPDHQERRCHI